MFVSLKKFYELFSKREKIKTIGLLALMFVGAIMEMIGIGAIPAFILIVSSPNKVLMHPFSGEIFRWFGVNDSRGLLMVGSIGLIMFFIFKGLLVSLINYIKIRFVQFKYIDLSTKLFNSYIFAPYTFHLDRNSSELLRNVTNETQIIIYYVFLSVLSIALSSMTMFFVLTILIIVQPYFTLIAITVLGSISWAFMRLVKKKVYEYGEEELEHRLVNNKIVLEALSGIKEIKVLGRESYFKSVYSYSIFRRARAKFYLEMVQSVNRPIIETITVIGVLGLALVLTAKDQSMERIIAVLALFAAATYRLMPTFQSLMMDVGTLRYYIHSVEPIYNDIVNLKSGFESESISENELKVSEKYNFQKVISFDHVSFTYPNSNQIVINDISLEIKIGEVVGIVGTSGAGKTTLVDLLLGLLIPQKGSISVDEKNIHQNIGAWQNIIGYIPQSIYLADDTVKRNIAFGLNDETISHEAYSRAANAAMLMDYINPLPEKEQTMIGEDGVRLSGGQRQRIGIARALYHDPRILIVDEGTSALDNITEKSVIEAIEKLRGERTIVMIAHRLSTVKNCDKIFFMSEGKILDVGTYSELLDRNEVFQKMASNIT